MSVAALPAAQPIIDEYILQAFKKAGLTPLEASIGFDADWNAKAAHGRVILNRLIEGLATKGFLDHFQSFTVVELVAGSQSYTQGTDWDDDMLVLNIIDTGSHIPESNDPEEFKTTGETPVSPMSMHQFQSLSSKTSEGTPTRYFLHRNAQLLTIYLWPIPAEDSKIRFRTLRIPASNSVGSNEPDLKRHWGSWIVHALAYELMTDAKLPLDERAICRDDRDAIMAEIKTEATSNEPPDVVFNHSSPWSNF